MLRALLTRVACGRAALGEPSSSAAGVTALLWAGDAAQAGAHTSAAPMDAVKAEAGSTTKASRAPTAFQLYLKDFATEFKANREANTNFFSEASRTFKELGQKKQQYEEKAAALKATAQAQAAAAAAEAKERKLAEREARAAKKATTSYSQYVKATYALVKEQNPNLNAKQVIAKVAQQWKGLSDDQKAEYKVQK